MKKNKFIGIRLDEIEFSYVKARAGMYADGNITEWVKHCLMNYQPRVIKKGPRKGPPITKKGK